MALKLQIIISSTRVDRKGHALGTWFKEHVDAEYPAFETELIDLVDWNLPMYGDAEAVTADGAAQVDAWKAKIAEADAYVIVAAEYNHSFTAPIKNAIDLPRAEWRRKPIGFFSYGGMSGGLRAVEALRLVVIELEMAPVRNSVSIPGIASVLSSRGLGEIEHKQIAVMIPQLEWWANALKTARV